MRTVTLLRCFFGIAALMLAPSRSQADEIYTFVVKKQEEKAKTRNYLTDWFEAKEKIRIMDMWLALHTPSPYEFYLSSDYRVSDDQKDSFPGDARFGFAAYVSIFGLEVHKTVANSGEFTGLFDLRIFGYHAQATNITLQGGIRTQGSPTYRSGVAGVAYTLYLVKPLGIDGFWRHYFDSTPNSTGNSVSGNRLELGPFLDFSFVRLGGGYFRETITTSSSASSSDQTHSGVFLGTKIFF
jgi:hypothetical protein